MWTRKNFLGLLFALLSSFFLALNGVFVKNIKSLTSTEISASQPILFWVILLPLVSCFSANKKKSEEKTQKKKEYDLLLNFKKKPIIGCLLRGILGITSTLVAYSGYKYLSVGDISCFQVANGIIATFLAFIFLKEKIDVIEGLFLIISIVGCILVSQPETLFAYTAFGK